MEKFTQAPVGLDIDQTVSSNSQAIANINSALRPTNEEWINNANLNDYTTTGLYMIGNSPTNAPTAWGALSVIANRTDTIYQTYAANGKFFYREFRNSLWGSWQELAIKNDIPSTMNRLTLTPNSSYIGSTNNHFFAKKYGNIIVVSGYGAISNAVPIGATLFTLDYNVNGFNGYMIKYSTSSAYNIYGAGANISNDQTQIPTGTYSMNFVACIT